MNSFVKRVKKGGWVTHKRIEPTCGMGYTGTLTKKQRRSWLRDEVYNKKTVEAHHRGPAVPAGGGELCGTGRAGASCRQWME